MNMTGIVVRHFKYTQKTKNVFWVQALTVPQHHLSGVIGDWLDGLLTSHEISASASTSGVTTFPSAMCMLEK